MHHSCLILMLHEKALRNKPKLVVSYLPSLRTSRPVDAPCQATFTSMFLFATASAIAASSRSLRRSVIELYNTLPAREYDCRLTRLPELGRVPLRTLYMGGGT